MLHMALICDPRARRTTFGQG